MSAATEEVLGAAAVAVAGDASGPGPSSPPPEVQRTGYLGFGSFHR